MLDPIKPFYQARLKHKWADEHIRKAISIWQDFLKTEFCKFVLEPDPDGGETIKVVSIHDAPPDLLLAVGDAIHNLRSALDYSINEMLGWSDKRMSFPVGEAREELEDAFRPNEEVINGKTKGKGRYATIEAAFPGIGAFIVDKISSYKGSGGLIWQLNKLEQRDKHRLLIATVSVQSISGISAVDKNQNSIGNLTAYLGPGDVFKVVKFGAGGVKIKGYGKPAAVIFLNEAGIIERQPMFETLIQFGQAVEEALNLIEGFALAAGWKPKST